MPLIWDGNWTGLCDSQYSGVKNCFFKAVGIDGITTPGILKVHQGLAKDSGATITAFCKVAVNASDGSRLWFSATDGKIWRESGGTYTLEHTTTPAAGAAGCLGAFEFDGYIYWATQSRLHRKINTDLSDWSDADEDFGTFGVTDDTYHPMETQNTHLFIGDGNQVARVDNEGAAGAHQFTANKLDINSPYRITALRRFSTDLLVGTIINTTVNQCQMLRWDTISESWSDDDTIYENGINAIIIDDNFTYVQAGRKGRIYFYDGAKNFQFKRVPGDFTTSNTAIVHPDSWAMFRTAPVFGLSNLSGNPADQGVYTFGSYSKDYPKAMDLSFVISEAVVASIEIGAILVSGSDLYVAWKNSSTFGVDKLSTTAKYSAAYIETMIQSPPQDRHKKKAIVRIYATYASKPASTNITFKIKKHPGDSFGSAITTVDDSNARMVLGEYSLPDSPNPIIRFDFTVSSDNAMEIETLGYDIVDSDQREE